MNNIDDVKEFKRIKRLDSRIKYFVNVPENHEVGVGKNIAKVIKNDKNINFYNEKIKNAPGYTQNVWKSYQEELNLKSIKTNRNAYFSPIENSVTFDLKQDLNPENPNIIAKGSTFFHEFGHHIDYTSSISSISDGHATSFESGLGNGIYNEIKNTISNYQNKFGEKKV